MSWIGDGYCDDGRYVYNGVPIYFNCQQFGNDGGDCDSPMPPIMNPPNHGAPETPPQYDPPPPPTPEQNKLIIVTHGWDTTFEAYANFWAPLRNVIRARVGPDWRVESYNWTEASQTLHPSQALDPAASLGAQLGQSIASQGYQHVHLIAHSAGSALIARAAQQIRADAPSTIIHTTYLDAYAGFFPGFTDFRDAYGSDSNWSDYYFSQEPLDVCFSSNPCVSTNLLGSYVATGPFTEQFLPNSFNLDVSLLDPDFNFPFCPLADSLSSHGWPCRFYRFTVDSSAVNCDPPTGGTLAYGFPLSYEYVGGDVQTWLNNVSTTYPKGIVESVPPGQTAASTVFDTQTSPPFDVDSTSSFASDAAAVQTAGGMLSLTTLPPGASQSVPAWINFQIATSAPVNFIEFELAFTGNPDALGLLTMYVNGHKCGMVNEPYALPGRQFYRLPTPGELAPGEHYLSFRLDHFNELESSVAIQSIATGFGQFVPACPADFDGNGEVQVPDIFTFLTAWFAGDVAAYEFGGTPGVPAIFAFLTAWFEGCP